MKFLFFVLATRYKKKSQISNPRLEHIKNKKISVKMIFFSKKTVLFIISDLFWL